MDTLIVQTNKRRIFKEFEYPDLIPYSIAIFMCTGFVYLLVGFSHIRM